MNTKPVLLIDNDCKFCSKTMQFIIKHGGEDKFQFLSLFSNEGREILKKYGFPKTYNSSVVLIEDNTAFIKSDAALRTAKKLSGVWPAFYGLRFIPKKFRDSVYDLIARHRHKIFK